MPRSSSSSSCEKCHFSALQPSSARLCFLSLRWGRKTALTEARRQCLGSAPRPPDTAPVASMSGHISHFAARQKSAVFPQPRRRTCHLRQHQPHSFRPKRARKRSSTYPASFFTTTSKSSSPLIFGNEAPASGAIARDHKLPLRVVQNGYGCTAEKTSMRPRRPKCQKRRLSRIISSKSASARG